MRVLVTLTLVAALAGYGGSRNDAGSNAASPVKAQMEVRGLAASRLAQLPVIFEPNRGQTDASVAFLSRIGHTRLFLTQDSAVFVVRNQAKQPATVVRMRTVNSARTLDEGIERLPGVSNYFIGRDSKKWVTEVPQFAKLRRKGVYQGIDMAFYGNQRQFEYDFVVAPGADPSQIALAFDGVDSIRTNANGDLVLATAQGELIQKRPKVYQERNGVRTEVAASYTVSQGKLVQFDLGRYEHAQPLVIDPVIVFNAEMGGRGRDWVYGIALDSSLNAYIVGSDSDWPDYPFVNSNPLLNGHQPSNVFSYPSKITVAKLNASGTALIYSTVIGGEGYDQGLGVAVDSSGNAVVGGITSSMQFPTVSPAQASYGGGATDGVLVKLNASGTALLFSTYLGGTGLDQPQAVAVDTAGNAYITGFSSGSYPTTNGAFQTAFRGRADCTLNKYSSAGALVYATYIGGSDDDRCQAVAADSSGNAYVTGYTFSSDFPRTNGAAQGVLNGQDAFVVKLNSTGSAAVYATLFGGTGTESGRSIALDNSGNAYITGSTTSPDLPVSAGAVQSSLGGLQNAFVAKLNAAGTSFPLVTYLGGRKSDSGMGIAVDSSNNIYVAGGTLSDNFPVANPVITTKPGIGGAIMKTTDSGTSFALTDTGISGGTATAVMVNASSGLVLSAVDGVLYESHNLGSSWISANPFPVTNFSAGRGATSAVVYAFNKSTFWYSTDGGVNWHASNSMTSFPISAMAVSPTDAGVVMAASSQGGVYLSTNNGASWTQAAGGIASTPMAAVAFVGDSTNAVACSYAYQGVYRTASAGANWTLWNNAIAFDSICTGITNDPNNSNILYITANDGLYKSTNGGATWTLLSAPGGSNYTVAVAVASGNSNIVYANANFSNNGIYTSTDGGVTWTASGALQTSVINALAVAPASSGTVFAATDITPEAVGFVTALNAGGTAYLYSTFLGGPEGSRSQGAQAVAVDASGNAYVASQSSSPAFQSTSGSLSAVYGSWEVAVTKIANTSPSCVLTFTTPNIVVPYWIGGSYPIEVFAPSGCQWSATPNASWVTILGPTSSTGSAATSIVVASNSGAARSTTVSFSTGQSITITQNTSTCWVDPRSAIQVAGAGGSFSIPIAIGAGCSWTATTNAPWLTILNPTGTGPGTINLTAQANPTTGSREAFINGLGGLISLFQAPPGYATISGRVTALSYGLAGVSINATGQQTATATTDGSGYYSLALLAGGQYTVTASLTGYNFGGPVAISSLTGNQTVSFVGVPNCLVSFSDSSNLVCSAITPNTSQGNSVFSIGAPSTYYGAITLVGNVAFGDAAGMALYNAGGGSGASVSLDFYNTNFNGGIPQAKVKAVDDGAYSDHLTFWTKTPGAASNAVTEKVRITSTGRVGIGTATPSLGPLQMGSGAYVSAGGVWTNASDRNVKENFLPVAASDILERIGQVPILEWNYKGEGPGVRHIGPVAQDFHSIFGLGGSSTSISTIDPSGIALAGVQALDENTRARNARLAELRKLLEAKDAELAAVEERLVRLEFRLGGAQPVSTAGPVNKK